MGKLIPGGKLPSYCAIQKQFGITYASAQRAYKNLEVAEKIKVVNGVCSILNGGDILSVDFYVTATSFEFAEPQNILDDISCRNNLNLNIRFITLSIKEQTMTDSGYLELLVLVVVVVVDELKCVTFGGIWRTSPFGLLGGNLR